MSRFIRLCATGLSVSLAAAPAAGQATSAMRVGATVAPPCTVSVEEAGLSFAFGPTVRAVCSRSRLRALRVTLSRGDRVQPVSPSFSFERKAGGEVAFAVPIWGSGAEERPFAAEPPRARAAGSAWREPPMALATVASNVPEVALDRSPVTVTLDF